VLRDGIDWLNPSDAIALILAAQKADIRLLGFDGAYLTDIHVQPSQEDSWDYSSNSWPRVSDPYAHAIKFIHERSQKGLHFEIVLDRQLQ
jgi:hypothetical protein